MPLFYISIFIFGLVIGSFLCAQVWRIRARQLVYDKEFGELYDKKELSRLKSIIKPLKSDRSICLKCKHCLSWYDLIPLLSWIFLRGKCRYCKKPIGFLEPFMELVTASLFLSLSILFLNSGQVEALAIMKLLFWLVAASLMMILFVYDMKWCLLPLRINYALIIVACVYQGIFLMLGDSHVIIEKIISLIGGVAVTSGLYGLMYYFSKGQYIGMGDVILCFGLSIMLGSFESSFMYLFLANLTGCVVSLPLLMTKKINRKSHISFGPYLIFATFITLFFEKNIIEFIYNITSMALGI